MKTKRTIPLLTLLVLAGVLATFAPAASGSSQASLVIRHQTRGCHSWSLNGGAYGANQALAVSRGRSVSITNNDVMPHQLIKTSGPAVTYTRLASGGMMGLKGTFPPTMLAHMGSSSKITFTKAGVYHFTTKPGEDYMQGIKTVGADNVLKLTVTVK
jgi:plastocyanin